MNESNDRSSSSYKYPVHRIREGILVVSALTGSLARLFLEMVGLDDPTITSCSIPMMVPLVPQQCSGISTAKTTTLDNWVHAELSKVTSQLMSVLVKMSMMLRIDLELAVLKKIELNRCKYPKELCKVCTVVYFLGCSFLYSDINCNRTSCFPGKNTLCFLTQMHF